MMVPNRKPEVGVRPTGRVSEIKSRVKVETLKQPKNKIKKASEIDGNEVEEKAELWAMRPNELEPVAVRRQRMHLPYEAAEILIPEDGSDNGIEER